MEGLDEILVVVATGKRRSSLLPAKSSGSPRSADSACSLRDICYPSRVKQGRLTLALLLLPLMACPSRPPATPEPSTSSPATAANRPQAAHAGATFDFYLLSLSWSPEFCHSHPAAAECALHSTFVMHGLWPQNDDGTYPQNCSNAPGPADPSQYSDVYPDAGLLHHEWTKHGTCSGLSADDYFSAARKVFHSVVVPAKLSDLTAQISLPPGQIVGLFTASNPQIPKAGIAVSCGGNYLTAVEVCLDKSLQPIACSSVKSCRANSVKIPPP
ncbi:MAG TPA: ribonuclease T2 [Terracidiphilus sp.]|nr:ribonuclease T2 [Terracidiphilus sp.]